MKNQKGITLIALVITIIVMLILVGVSVTVALNGGLFSTAKEAAEGTASKRNEELELSSGKVEINGEWYNSIDEYVKGAEGTGNESGSGSESEETALAPGLYAEDGTMTKSWEQLIADGDLIVTNGVLFGGEQCSDCASFSAGNAGWFLKLSGKLVVSNNVTTLGQGAFGCPLCQMGSDGLTGIELPNTLTEIKSFAFEGCNNITELIIPNSVIDIQGGGLEYIPNLQNVVLSNSMTKTNYGVLAYNQNLKSVTINSSVSQLGENTFANCKSLNTINFIGSISQWSNIQRVDYWNLNCPEITVHCTDGDITISAYGS